MADANKYAHATIVKPEDFSSDLWSFRVQPDIPFPFTREQYAIRGIERDGQVVERPYSIVSSPHESELELFIELVPDGLLTPLAVGAELLLRTHADELGGSPENSTAYLCGHPGVVENARVILVRRGLGRHFIHEEQYWPPGKATGG